jgi:hypothetical protein
MKMTDASELDDATLAAELARMAGGERRATAALIVHLAEFDARRLYEPPGFSSLFEYGRRVLHLSEDAIYNRIETARAARRWPAILDMLITGRLSVTTARMLARRLSAENHQALLAEASGKGKRDVEELLARHFPQADVATSVRRLPIVRALAAERYEIRFTVTTKTRDKLRAAQDLLGHVVPSGDLAEIFDRALTALLRELATRKCAATGRRHRSPGQSPRSRNIPAEVRRAVWARDGGACAFVSEGGRRCGARRWVEFHHVIPFAAGGKPTVENIHLRCRAHNGHEVERFFGASKRYGVVPERVQASNRQSSFPELSPMASPGTSMRSSRFT